MGHNGELLDDMSGLQLNSEEVVAARLDEIEQLQFYDVYENVPIEQCWDSTGRALVKIKGVDMDKGDTANHDPRSRLVAEQVKLNKRLNFFGSAPPLGAKKAAFSMAVTKGIGYKAG